MYGLYPNGKTTTSRPRPQRDVGFLFVHSTEEGLKANSLPANHTIVYVFVTFFGFKA
jgi:hypothetical protein